MRSNSARRMRTRPTLTSASTRPANMRNIDIGISSVSISKLTWLLLWRLQKFVGNVKASVFLNNCPFCSELTAFRTYVCADMGARRGGGKREHLPPPPGIWKNYDSFAPWARRKMVDFLYGAPKTCRLFKVSVILPPSGKISTGAHRLIKNIEFCPFNATTPEIFRCSGIIRVTLGYWSKPRLCNVTMLKLCQRNVTILQLNQCDVTTLKLNQCDVRTLKLHAQLDALSCMWAWPCCYCCVVCHQVTVDQAALLTRQTTGARAALKAPTTVRASRRRVRTVRSAATLPAWTAPPSISAMVSYATRMLHQLVIFSKLRVVESERTTWPTQQYLAIIAFHSIDV